MTGSAEPERPVAELVAIAHRWVEVDPDPGTAASVRGAVERAEGSGSAVELASMFGPPLRFGTAGIRGRLGPGPGAMNRVVVRCLAAAVGEVLGRDGRCLVIVGHDARHGSDRFARDAAEVLAGLGHRVVLAVESLPTPVLAFAGRTLAAAATLVVTASHNPSADNGVKVYWGDGAQIVPPIDDAIGSAMARRLSAIDDPAAAVDSVVSGSSSVSGGTVAELSADLVDAYVNEVVERATGVAEASGVRAALTSLHGVGGAIASRCLTSLGVAIAAVPSQQEPDPDFPTVAFPNPEEPGATDLLAGLAAESGAMVAFANDPDADRLAVLIPDDWRRLSGDEVGALFIEGLAQRIATPGALVVSTVVSSQLAGVLAAHHGLRHVETLTGFKWLCRPAIAEPTAMQLLAYEEALGYAFDGQRDKDGIAAAAVFSALVAAWAREGRTVADVLADIAERHGLYYQHNLSRPIEPGRPPQPTGLLPPVGVVVCGATVIRSDAPAADVARIWFDDGARIVVRPSGTEPKLKLYIEVVDDDPVPGGAVTPRERWAARRERARHRAAELSEAVSSQRW